MRNNPVQFAVVREDPLVEASILWEMPHAKNVLMVASGGCTSLSLSSLLPDIQLTLIDLNPSQLELVQKKQERLRHVKAPDFKSIFNIEDSRSSGLNACGNFESLFRGLREFIFELILPYGEMRLIFEKENIADASRERIFSSKYWPVAFEMYFCDGLMRAMLGEKALLKPPQKSYPDYFRNVLERGFQRVDARTNYFLHHIFLGHYFDNDACLPIYLSQGAVSKFAGSKNTGSKGAASKTLNRPAGGKTNADEQLHFHLGGIQSLKDELKNFDMVSLSNIFDWIDEKEVTEIGALLGQEMKPGSRLVFRQLNREVNFAQYFSRDFEFNAGKEEELLAKDRSLFYSKFNIGVKK